MSWDLTPLPPPPAEGSCRVPSLGSPPAGLGLTHPFLLRPTAAVYRFQPTDLSVMMMMMMMIRRNSEQGWSLTSVSYMPGIVLSLRGGIIHLYLMSEGQRG